MVKVEVDEYHWVYNEVGREQNVKYDAIVVRQLAHEVVDRMWEAEHQVTDEHRQHGSRCLVHNRCRSRLVLTGG